MRLIRLLWNVKIASTFSFKFGLMFVDFFHKTAKYTFIAVDGQLLQQ